MGCQITKLVDAQRCLLNDVSHELRSPLTRLQAATALARQQPEKNGGHAGADRARITTPE